MTINVNHYLHFVDDGSRAEILSKLNILLSKVEKIMKTLDDVLTLVTKEDTDIDSLVALVKGLKQQVADALSGTTLPPAVQAKVDAVFDTATGSAQKVVDALAANVP